jgi:ADP-ribose pyrophosphatase YjhB (NUDIX family)
LADACVRETREECGLDVTVEDLLGTVIRPAEEPDAEFVINDFHCSVTGGDLAAGDDAAEVAWVSRDALDTCTLVAGLAETLRGWGVLPAAQRGSHSPG